MVDQKMRDIMAGYLSDDELKDVEKMMGSSKEDYVAAVIHKMNVLDRPQYIRASIVMFKEISLNDGASVFSYVFDNLSSDDQTTKVEMTFDNCNHITKELRLIKNQRSEGVFKLSVEELSSYIGKSVSFTVEVFDCFERSVAASSDFVTIVEVKPAAMVTADTEIIPCKRDGSNSYRIGNVKLQSKDSQVQCCIVSATTKNGFRYVKSVDLAPGKTESLDIVVSDSDLNVIGSDELSLSVEIDGRKVTESKGRLNQSGSTGSGIKLTNKKIFAECIGQMVVDTNMKQDGKVFVGEIIVLNNSSSPETICWIISMNGDNIELKNRITLPGQTSKIPVLIPEDLLSRDTSFTTTIRCQVFDSTSGSILDNSFTINVRSKFDMDLSRLRELTAKAVDPHNDVIKKFIVSGNGQLAKTMGENYQVCGYQIPDFIIPQLDGLFNAIRDYGISYVSDVTTIEGKGQFQRVRDPATVLNDHSGNCIELSILFASMLETMGFEPIIVFPRGHAIVGIIINNMYGSTSKCGEELKNRSIRINDRNKFVEALFFESTMCADKKSSFSQALERANNIISKQIEWINTERRYSIICKDRTNGGY